MTAGATLEIPLPARGENPQGFATTTVLLGPDTLLTSWVEGTAAVRVGILDLVDGAWRVLTGVRGMLRGAVPLPDRRALLLTEHGLFEADLATPVVTRKLTARIGKHNDEIRLERDGLVAIGQQAKTTEALVSMATLEYAGRQRRTPVPGRSIEVAAARAGVVRVLLERDHLLVGATSAYPGEHGQRLLVLDAAREVVASVVMPWGVASAHLWGDGLIAAPLRLGRGIPLLALPGLPA
ncbi:hypothetical protein KVF89_29025 [Nocardioides carbamazepini]|uniref:hypothetical protein n=1 Tax=Nocardioides carbamazepini TaxID=2854259 RepID=UPI002149EDE0|nr:hypothetical protein [Nocardioides carbamazepini]MCR1786613.1 hypothetical protein [Nocardioides carbamazepini]